ncbi:hypothetical protein [Agromyces sp. NPDC049794]|uniref:hypothetical protein n=1 Tax=unclassified Agromyces TaxID=2639701 RepID=UPI0033C0B5B4
MPRDDFAARLLLALELRDERALASLLNPDVAMVADTGDPTGAELRGRARVARALLGLRMPHPDASLEIVHVNGGPGLAVRGHDGIVVGVLVIDVDPSREPDGGNSIDRLWLTAAPGKLAHWNRRRPTVE